MTVMASMQAVGYLPSPRPSPKGRGRTIHGLLKMIMRNELVGAD